MEVINMPTDKADIFTLAKFGNIETFKTKFNINDINKKYKNGSSLLHFAISGKQFDIALFLIKNGIDINMTNSDGQTALHLICINQNLDIAKELLQNGIDINVRDKYGNNAIWTAVFNCKGKNYDMVKLLKNYNADINNKNNVNKSPLDFAKQINDDILINLLENN